MTKWIVLIAGIVGIYGCVANNGGGSPIQERARFATLPACHRKSRGCRINRILRGWRWRRVCRKAAVPLAGKTSRRMFCVNTMCCVAAERFRRGDRWAVPKRYAKLQQLPRVAWKRTVTERVAADPAWIAGTMRNWRFQTCRGNCAKLMRKLQKFGSSHAIAARAAAAVKKAISRLT